MSGFLSAGIVGGPDIPDGLVDNFEDANADPAGVYETGQDLSTYYTPNSGSFDDWTRTTSTVFEGSKAMVSQFSTGNTRDIHSVDGDGLNAYPDVANGTTFEARLYLGNSSSGGEIAWGGPDASNRYELSLSANSGQIELRRVDSGSFTQLDNYASAPSTSEWLRIEIEHLSDGSITAIVEQSDGTQITSLSATDTNHTTKSIGFGNDRTGASTGGEFWDGVRIL